MKNIRLYLFLYFTAAMALDVVYRSLDRVVRGRPPAWGETFLDQTTGFYFTMLLLPAIFYVARRWPFRGSFARIGIHVAAVVLYTIVHTSLLWGSRTVLSPLFGLGLYDYGAMPLRYLMEFPSDVISYAMWVTSYTVYHNWLRAKEIETQLVSARLVSLTHRLQPHFLFNALNAVSATMYEDVGRADRMIEGISDFLRATLKLPDSPMVPLSTEIALARQYLEVMKARLEGQLQFEIQCDANAESARVPALLLQPLVENAIEHGQDPASGKLDVRVDAARCNGFVTISIQDRGRGFSSSAAGGNGHGLSNARSRLKAAYGEGASLDLGATSGAAPSGARVEIRIPA
jgi:two-component system LytT family sensor kinase